MDFLLVVDLTGSLEDFLDSLFAAVLNLKVEIGTPHVELALFLLHVDASHGLLSNLACLGQVTHLHLEDHEFNPEICRVRVVQEESLIVAGNLRTLGVQLASSVDFST